MADPDSKHATPPAHLPPKAKAFWRTNYPLLADRLVPTDLPGFEVLCLDWHYIQTVDPMADGKLGMLWNACKKTFLAGLKQYGLTPDARRRVDPPKVTSLNDVLAGVHGPKEQRAN